MTEKIQNPVWPAQVSCRKRRQMLEGWTISTEAKVKMPLQQEHEPVESDLSTQR